MNVLVVDDSESSRGVIRRALEQSDLSVQVVEAADGAQALPVALSGDVDIVVSDVVMPNLDGIGLLRAIRQERDPESLPVIFVTSQDDFDRRELSFLAGVNDYISRPFAPIELVTRVQVQLRMKRLQQELRRTNERYRRLGSHDELTGLANRRSFSDVCRRELARSRRYRFAMSVAILDIDGFRGVNDRSGSLVGDAVIAEMAAVLQAEMRTADVMARVGGEKFAALLPQTDRDQARLVCDRLCVAVREHAFPNHEAGDLTLSVGYATYPHGGIESVDEITNAAEASLDSAKAGGGDRSEGWAEKPE